MLLPTRPDAALVKIEQNISHGISCRITGKASGAFQKQAKRQTKSQGGNMQMHAVRFDDIRQRWELILAVGSVWAALLLTGFGIMLLAATISS